MMNEKQVTQYSEEHHHNTGYHNQHRHGKGVVAVDFSAAGHELFDAAMLAHVGTARYAKGFSIWLSQVL